MSIPIKPALAVLPLLALAGCMPPGDFATQSALYEDKQASFQAVAVKSATATGKRTTWLHTGEAARQAAREVHAMVHRKTISADTAVQVALLNNKGLQAAYADIGIDAADVWQQILPENPVVSIGIMGIAAPEVVLFRALEAMIATNLQTMMTRERRVDIARTRFAQTSSRRSTKRFGWPPTRAGLGSEPYRRLKPSPISSRGRWLRMRRRNLRPNSDDRAHSPSRARPASTPFTPS